MHRWLPSLALLLGATAVVLGYAPAQSDPPMGVEYAEKMSLTPARRWQMFRDAKYQKKYPGKPWQWWFTREEYIGFANQFEFTKARFPREYEKAIKARDSFLKASEKDGRFHSTVWKAAIDVSLRLTSRGELEIATEKASLAKVLEKATIDKLYGTAKDKVLRMVLREEAITVLGIAEQLNEIRKAIDNENLLKKGDRDEILRKKVSLVLDMMAVEQARKTRDTIGNAKRKLHNRYYEYEKISDTYSNYLSRELQLHPNAQPRLEAPSFRPPPN